MARRERIREKKDSYLIIVEGLTEYHYFKHFFSIKKTKNNISYSNLKGKVKISEIENEIRKNKNDYTKIFVIIDTDGQSEREKKSKEKIIKKYENSQSTQIISSYPCFELWLLLHFIYTTKPCNSCNDIEIDNCIEGYAKTEKFLSDKKWVTNLISYVDKAIDNSKKLESQGIKLHTDVYKLLNIISPKEKP